MPTTDPGSMVIFLGSEHSFPCSTIPTGLIGCECVSARLALSHYTANGFS